MPYWDEVVQMALTLAQTQGPQAFDIMRRAFLHELSATTKRDTIVYAMSDYASIEFIDVHGMMAVMPGLKSKNLDIILHSSGGSGEAAKAIIDYLRARFDHIRVIVPIMAMSAATILACGADEIVLGKHSFLGPTDPQFLLQTPLGIRRVALQDILNQFEMAKRDLADGAPISAWMAMLNNYGPDLLASCVSARGLSEDLVKTMLKENMFKAAHEGEQRATEIAAWLSHHENFLSHGRYIPRHELETRGLKIKYLEEDNVIQDLVLTIFHCLTYSFKITNCTKLIENQDGRAYTVSDDMPIPLPTGFIPPSPQPQDPVEEMGAQEEVESEPDSGSGSATST